MQLVALRILECYSAILQQYDVLDRFWAVAVCKEEEEEETEK